MNHTVLTSLSYPVLERIWNNDEDDIYDKELPMAIKIAQPGGAKASGFGGPYELIMVEKESGEWLLEVIKELTRFDGTGRVTFPGDGEMPKHVQIVVELDQNEGGYPYVGVYWPQGG